MENDCILHDPYDWFGWGECDGMENFNLYFF